MSGENTEAASLGRPNMRGMAGSLALNAVCPFVGYQVFKGQGLSDVAALSATAVFPLVGILVGFARTRRADGLGVLVLGFIVLGVAASLISGSTRFALVKESAGTGLFGLVFLGSLFARRPLTFYFGRQFATGGDPDRIAYWDGLWRYDAFRRAQRFMSVVWGVAFLLEAGVRVVLSYSVSAATVVAVSPVLSIGVFVLLMTFTIRYGRMVRDRSIRERGGAAAVAGEGA